MLASEVLRRIIANATTTALRPSQSGAAVGTFGASGLLLPGEITAGPSHAFQQTFVTASLDLTQVQSLIIVPALPGYYSAMGGRNWLIDSHAGTQTTPLTCKAGTNVAHDNFIALTTTTPTNALVNAAVPPCLLAGPNFPNNGVQQNANTAVTLDITLGASGTGGFALRGRLAFAVGWYPV